MFLVIDTVSAEARIGIGTIDGELLTSSDIIDSRRLVMDLAKCVANHLTENGLSLAEISGVIVAIGPGGFSSTRAGVAFAAGLVAALRSNKREISLFGIGIYQLLSDGRDIPAVAKLGKDQFILYMTNAIPQIVAEDVIIALPLAITNQETVDALSFSHKNFIIKDTSLIALLNMATTMKRDDLILQGYPTPIYAKEPNIG